MDGPQLARLCLFAIPQALYKWLFEAGFDYVRASRKGLWPPAHFGSARVFRATTTRLAAGHARAGWARPARLAAQHKGGQREGRRLVATARPGLAAALACRLEITLRSAFFRAERSFLAAIRPRRGARRPASADWLDSQAANVLGKPRGAVRGAGIASHGAETSGRKLRIRHLLAIGRSGLSCWTQG